VFSLHYLVKDTLSVAHHAIVLRVEVRKHVRWRELGKAVEFREERPPKLRLCPWVV